MNKPIAYLKNMREDYLNGIPVERLAPLYGVSETQVLLVAGGPKLALDMDTYQKACLDLCIYPDVGKNVMYPVLGMIGEAGEVADKLKKLMRDDGIDLSDIPDDKKELLKKEIGDVLFYVAALSFELGSSLREIAKMNIDKLQDRQARGELKGSGDER